MTAHVLVSGTLFRSPEERTGKTSGKSFVAATIKVRDGDAAQFLRALAFSAEAQNELLRLDDGDSSASGLDVAAARAFVERRLRC